ncbi:hypothetical protein ACNQFN_01830 [Thauera butanivorans]|uniref:hypothetical protein n=1 Tax=Thauera butanivorans TaxID=86174 RepID=UPI003AB42F1A
MIQALYRLAGITPVWDGAVNQRVAEVFGTMLFETQKCSRAFAWAPKPSGGKPSPFWLITYLGNGIFQTHLGRLSMTCARQVIRSWQSELNLAEMGIAHRKLPVWENT